jgi:uncharacterized membrane protein YbhN (UPF0104 family)
MAVWSAGLAVSAICCWLTVRGIHLAVALHRAEEAQPLWLLGALAAFVAATGVRAMRWWVLFDPPDRPPLRATGSATLIGYLFNSVLPARAGEAARVIALRRSSQRPAAEIAGTVIVERLIDTAALFALLAALSPWLPTPAVSPIALWAIAVASVIGLGLVAAAPRLAHRVPTPSAIRPYAAQVVAGLTAVVRRPRIAASCSALTLLSWGLMGLSTWALMQGMSIGRGPQAGLFVAIATGIAMVVPSAPASFGVFEAATVLVLSAFGVARAPALGFAIVLHALNVVPLIAAGLVALAGQRRTREAPPPGEPAQDVEPAVIRTVLSDPGRSRSRLKQGR